MQKKGRLETEESSTYSSCECTLNIRSKRIHDQHVFHFYRQTCVGGQISTNQRRALNHLKLCLLLAETSVVPANNNTDPRPFLPYRNIFSLLTLVVQPPSQTRQPPAGVGRRGPNTWTLQSGSASPWRWARPCAGLTNGSSGFAGRGCETRTHF